MSPGPEHGRTAESGVATAPQVLPADFEVWPWVPADRLREIRETSLKPSVTVLCDLSVVEPSRRHHARRDASQWLTHGGRAVVRVGPHGTDDFHRDMNEVAALPGTVAVVVPRLSVPAALRSVARRFERADTAIIAQVDSAQSLARATEIASLPDVSRLLLAADQLAQDLQVADDSRTLDYARAELVIASRLGGLDRPIEHRDVSVDDEPARRAHLRRDGFGGMTAALRPVVQTVDRLMGLD